MTNQHSTETTLRVSRQRQQGDQITLYKLPTTIRLVNTAVSSIVYKL